MFEKQDLYCYPVVLLYVFIGIFVLHALIGLILTSVAGKQSQMASGNFDWAGISVVIPFRNEADRIELLLKSINALKIPDSMLVEFIFVNDHSDDKTGVLIQEILEKPHKVIQSELKGKKNAIDQGVSISSHQYIITWDADIEVPPSYFQAITNLDQADMWILPVNMTGTNLVSRLASIEFIWLQFLTFAYAKRKRAKLCNGANLLFAKKMYHEVKSDRVDFEIKSGDDMFLLDAFIKKGAKIKANANRELEVKTSAPKKLKALLAQRKRWISKMPHLKSLNPVVTVIFMTMVYGSFIGALICLQFSILFLIPLGMKIINEWILLNKYRNWKRIIGNLMDTLIHQVFYPPFILMMVLPIRLESKRWDH